MDERDIRRLLERLQAGRLSVDDAIERLRHLPSEDLGFAKIDHHRALRQGFAEVIFGHGKTPQQVTAIVRGMLRPKDSKHNILIARSVVSVRRPNSIRWPARL
jgi:NCAIR mutase (PurE)-related protein